MFDSVTLERFWSKVDKSGGPDACWPWKGTKQNGYGCFTTKRKTYRAHRISLLVKTGREDLFAINGVYYDVPNIGRHMCHNKACVNPAHLKWGTPEQNSQDRPAECRARSAAKANATKALTGNWGGIPAQPIGTIQLPAAYYERSERIRKGLAEAKLRRHALNPGKEMGE